MYRPEGVFVHQFDIVMRSFQQVQNFVKLAMNKPFDIMVGNEHQNINGKDIMGMFSLDYRFPLKVSVTCSKTEFEAFLDETKVLCA